MAVCNLSLTESLAKNIQTLISQEADRILNENIERLKRDVETACRLRVGQIAATVCQRLSFDYSRDMLTIRVDFSDMHRDTNNHSTPT